MLKAPVESEPLGHDEVRIPVRAATCTTDGLSSGRYCSRCGEVFSTQKVIPATGHKESVGSEGEKATCTSSGLTAEILCDVCNVILVEQTVIPALGHVEEILDVIVEPTETTDGVQTIWCVNCNEILRFETIPATGTTRVPGDANENGTVDIRDAVIVLQYAAGENVSINTRNADVNADGNVDIYDALRILQYGAGWDVELE